MIKQLALGSLALGMALSAWAQSDGNYPSRPIRVVVPYAAGGATDFIARTLGERLGKTLGQLHLGALCVQVRTVKRRSARHIAPDLDFELHADDVLVLLGTPEQIATAELLLLGGKH